MNTQKKENRFPKSQSCYPKLPSMNEDNKKREMRIRIGQKLNIVFSILSGLVGGVLSSGYLKRYRIVGH